MMNAKLMSTSKLTGLSITNPRGENLGDIKDVVFDLETGNVAYVVISFGGFLGIGDKYFAVPWKALSIEVEKEKGVMDVDKKMLENAPGFNKDDWPSNPDRGFVHEVHKHYGYKPYWERDARYSKNQEQEEDIFITETPGVKRRSGNAKGSSVDGETEPNSQVFKDIDEQRHGGNKPFHKKPSNSGFVGGFEKQKKVERKKERNN